MKPEIAQTITQVIEKKPEDCTKTKLQNDVTACLRYILPHDYYITEEYRIGPYQVDIAIFRKGELKPFAVIEVNGPCHCNSDGTYNWKYQAKESLLLQMQLSVISIHYLKWQNDINKQSILQKIYSVLENDRLQQLYSEMRASYLSEKLLVLSKKAAQENEKSTSLGNKMTMKITLLPDQSLTSSLEEHFAQNQKKDSSDKFETAAVLEATVNALDMENEEIGAPGIEVSLTFSEEYVKNQQSYPVSATTPISLSGEDATVYLTMSGESIIDNYIETCNSSPNPFETVSTENNYNSTCVDIKNENNRHSIATNPFSFPTAPMPSTSKLTSLLESGVYDITDDILEDVVLLPDPIVQENNSHSLDKKEKDDPIR